MLLRSLLAATAAALSALACGGTDGAAEDPCIPEDADGILGTEETFIREVDDQQFLPAQNLGEIKVQNLTKVTLTVTNVGTKVHSFIVDCLATPNDLGCAQESCFPPEANIPSIDPGESETVSFSVPLIEGTYTYRSDQPGDSHISQIVVD